MQFQNTAQATGSQITAIVNPKSMTSIDHLYFNTRLDKKVQNIS